MPLAQPVMKKVCDFAVMDYLCRWPYHFFLDGGTGLSLPDLRGFMQYFLYAVGLCFAAASMSFANTSTVTRTWVTPDFFVDQDSREHPHFQFLIDPTVEDCRAHIKDVMCLVEPGADGEEAGTPRPCLKGGQKYAAYFEQLYDRFPSALQKMFCSIDTIFIEKAFFGTAYAGVKRDRDGHIVGAVMGIRQSALDEELNLKTWAGWKEQLSFGASTEKYEVHKHLPLVATPGSKGVNDFLYFVVAHEFGHIFDFTNELNKTNPKKCSEATDGGPECEMEKGSWGALSWKSELTPLKKNDFTHRDGLCFYWCKDKPLEADAISAVYDGLARTDFLSIYATTQPWDDFADSLAYYLLDKELRQPYVIERPDGVKHDVMVKLGSKKFAAKKKYIEQFLQRVDIRYP